MGSTAPPGRPNSRSTPSRLSASSTMRAPGIFTSVPPGTPSRCPSFSSPARAAPRGLALPDAGLGRGEPGHGNLERRTRHVAHADAVAEFYRRLFPSVLATDADLELGTDPTAPFDAQAHQLSHSLLVQHGEGVVGHQALVEVMGQELAHIVAAVAVGHLGEVVGPE